MKIMNVFKKCNRMLARGSLQAAFWLAKIVPYRFLYAFVDCVVMLVLYRTNSRLLRNARQSIDLAFGNQKSQKEKDLLVRLTFKNLGRVIAEGIHYIARPQVFEGNITIEGESHLKAALGKGKGIVAVTAHLGNFPLMLGWLAGRGYRVNVLMRPSRDSKMAEFIVEKFSLFGGKIIFTVPERECVQKSIKALRQNELLFILIDQNYGADARIFVDFFGHKAATGASPVAFARRTGAGILPVFCVRKEGDLHIIVEPGFDLKGDIEEDICLRENVQGLTRIIERYVRQYPELWSWMHNRWKSKPVVSDKDAGGRAEDSHAVIV